MSVFLMVALAASVGCRSDPPAVSAPTAPEPALVEDASALAQPVGLPPDRAPTMEAMLVTDRLRTASARHVTLSAGGRWIVVLGRSGSIQVLTGARGRIVLERTFLPDQPCSGLAVTPNGRRLLVRGTDGVRLLNLWTGDVLQTVVPGVGWTCGLSVDGEHILVAKEGVLRVFDAGGSEPTSELELPFEGAVRRIQASAGARTVVVSSDEQAWVWGGNHRSRWRALSGWNPAGPLVVSSSGEWIAGRLGELKVRLWDGKFGTAKKEFRAAHVHGFLAQDKNVLLRNAQGELTVMEIETGEPIVSQSTFPGVLAVGMNPAGTAAAVVGGSTTEHWVGVWNLQSGPRFQRNQQRVRPRSLRWTFDGKALQIRSAS